MELDLNSITATDFKDFFPRDFPYLEFYILGREYNTGDIVFTETPKGFFTCLNDRVFTFPTDTENWVENKELKKDNFILDKDIEKAFCEAQQNFNKSLFRYTEDILSIDDSPGVGTHLFDSIYLDGENAALSNGKLTTIDISGNVATIFAVSTGILRITLNDTIHDIVDLNFTVDEIASIFLIANTLAVLQVIKNLL